jgi:hypothetical protein
MTWLSFEVQSAADTDDMLGEPRKHTLVNIGWDDATYGVDRTRRPQHLRQRQAVKL